METKVNNLGPNGTGKVASDFPIIQYLVAKIWKITGVKTGIFRMINLLFLLMGLYYVYRIFLLLSGQNFGLSILITALFFTSPILSYYGPTTLSDIHAFATSVCAFYYFLKWQQEQKNKWFILSILLFAIAGLFKMSSAFIYIIAIAFYFIRLIVEKRNGEHKTYIKDVLVKCALFVLPFIPWILWYGHANAYNKENPNGFFLIGILPIWEIPAEKVKELASFLFYYIFPQMINPFVFGTLFSATVSIISMSAKKFLSETNLRLLVLIGVFAGFILLFYQVFDVHDYYMLNMMNILILISAVLVAYFTNGGFIQKLGKPLKAILLILVVAFTYSTAIKTRSRIDYGAGWGIKELALTKEERDFLSWNSWYDRTHYEVLEKKDIDWKKIGIGENDIVFCAGDYTINRSLYLMNRRGFTTFNTGPDGMGAFIEEKKKTIGLKYLILIEPEWKQKPDLQKFLARPIFAKDNMTVYEL